MSPDGNPRDLTTVAQDYLKVIWTAQEWSLSATADNHPFHLHVNPFEVIRRDPKTGQMVAVNSARGQASVTVPHTAAIAWSLVGGGLLLLLAGAATIATARASGPSPRRIPAYSAAR